MESQQTIAIGLCRGAARAQIKDWGAIIRWKYSDPPYIEAPIKFYYDMVSAYTTGGKYLVIFNYTPEIGQYGFSTEGHLTRMKDFWTYVHSNLQYCCAIEGEVAHVLPED